MITASYSTDKNSYYVYYFFILTYVLEKTRVRYIHYICAKNGENELY